MKIRIIFYCFFFLISIDAIAEFRLENWKNHTSYLQATAVSVDSESRIWAGSTGGVFIYDMDSNDYLKFNNLNGLLGIEVSAIYCDKSSKEVFIGTADGILTICSEDFVWEHFLDIQESKFPNAKINRFLKHNNSLYIAGGFGLAVFDLEKRVFKESILRIGDFDRLSNVNDIYIDNETIWVATSSGVGKANINSTIANPNSWKTFSTQNGLNDNETIALTKFNNEIYVGTKKALFKFDEDTLLLVQNTAEWDEIKKLDEYQGELLITTQYYIKTLFDKTVYSPFNGIIDGSFVEQELDSFIVANFRNQGIYIYKDSTKKQILPNSPYSNNFGNLSVAPNGDLWAATDISPRGRGFMHYNGKDWNNFFADSLPEIKSNHYYRIFSRNDNTVFVSNWGTGFLKITPSSDSLIFENFDNTNTPLTSISTNPNYVITGDIAEDKRGNLWVVNYGENSSGPVLLAYSDNTYYPFTNCISPTNRYYIPMAVDFSNTKWLGSNENAGLLFFNEMQSLDNTNDDICGQLNSSNSGLPNNTVKCIEVDKSGYIWIGTTNGLAVIYTPSTILTNKTATVRQNQLLGAIRINDILIDALDNKWIATNDGVWVLNSDCSEVIYYINKNTTPIVSDKVISLASDPQTGKVYFGTAAGISEVTSISISPLSEFDIKCYPQPYDPVYDGDLIIDGLSSEAKIRILTISGDFVKDISSFSRKAVWDGRDYQGNYVSSGIYIISASSTGTGNNGLAKFAIIRK